MPRNKAILAACAALASTGCLHEDDVPRPADASSEAASAEGRFRDRGATVAVRAWSCAGVAGRWHVRVRISGAAEGEGAASVVLRPRQEARLRDEFRVRVARVPATARVDLRVRLDGDVLAVSGDATATAFAVRLRTPVDERLDIRRGPIPECR